jgi:hypothetical protein
VTALELASGERLDGFDAYVSALPVDVFKRLVPRRWSTMPFFRQFDALQVPSRLPSRHGSHPPTPWVPSAFLSLHGSHPPTPWAPECLPLSLHGGTLHATLSPSMGYHPPCMGYLSRSLHGIPLSLIPPSLSLYGVRPSPHRTSFLGGGGGGGGASPVIVPRASRGERPSPDQRAKPSGRHRRDSFLPLREIGASHSKQGGGAPRLASGLPGDHVSFSRPALWTRLSLSPSPGGGRGSGCGGRASR